MSASAFVLVDAILPIGNHTISEYLRSGSYDDWTKDELLQRARELGIRGRSSMSKAQLIDALRNH